MQDSRPSERNSGKVTPRTRLIPADDEENDEVRVVDAATAPNTKVAAKRGPLGELNTPSSSKKQATYQKRNQAIVEAASNMKDLNDRLRDSTQVIGSMEKLGIAMCLLLQIWFVSVLSKKRAP